MSKLIVITGITGVQGSSIAETYLQTPGWKVRGLTRNISSSTSQSWASKGVEMVQADVNHTSSLLSAFRGASIIFGVTDFWTIFKDPSSQTLKKPGQDITEYCFEVELQQGKNLADAAAQIGTLEKYIFSSMASATKWSKGKFTTLYHMDSKAQAVEYTKALPGLKGKFSEIQAPIYYNLLWQWGLPTTPSKQGDGTYNIQGIGSADIPVPFGDVQGDFGRCFKAVVDSNKPGINFLAVGEMMSWNQYLDIWCRSQNLPPGKVELKTLKEYEEILPGGLGREFGENVLFGQQFGYDGGDPTVIRPSDLYVKMTSFEEYCKKTDFSAILG